MNCREINNNQERIDQIARVVKQVVTKRIRKEKIKKLKSKFNI